MSPLPCDPAVLALLLALVLAALASAWTAVEILLLPRFIPRAEIERLADWLIREDAGDPEGAALAREDHARLRGDRFEQGKWRRVRALIARRRRA